MAVRHATQVKNQSYMQCSRSFGNFLTLPGQSALRIFKESVFAACWRCYNNPAECCRAGKYQDYRNTSHSQAPLQAHTCHSVICRSCDLVVSQRICEHASCGNPSAKHARYADSDQGAAVHMLCPRLPSLRVSAGLRLHAYVSAARHQAIKITVEAATVHIFHFAHCKG